MFFIGIIFMLCQLVNCQTCGFQNILLLPGQKVSINTFGTQQDICYFTLQSPPGSRILVSCPIVSLIGQWSCGYPYCVYGQFCGSVTGDAAFSDIECVYSNKPFEYITPGNKFSAFYRLYHRTKYVGIACELEALSTHIEPYVEDCLCGKPSSSRIINGTDSEQHDHPWGVSFQTTNDGSTYKHFCGGALLNNQWILTAAHCLEPFKNEIDNVAVVAGDHVLNDPNESYYTQSRTISSMIIHEKFNNVTNENDIGLVKLSAPVVCAKGVQPICLPPKLSQNDLKNKKALLAGWGVTVEGGDHSNVLKEVEVPFKTSDECRNIIGDAFKDQVKDGMICTYKPGVDACQGDSGSPVSWESDGKTYVVGIVSWGIGCAQDGYPGVHTFVPNYLDWINSKTNLSS